jgi:hypothetical protein
MNFPPLATTGDLNDAVPGALNQPHTTVVIDPSGNSDTHHSGGRVTVGYAIERMENTLSLDGSFFALETRTDSRLATGDGQTVLARPFFNIVTNSQDADPVALPGIASGTVQVGLSTKFYGADANLRWHVWSDQGDHLVLIFGGRYLDLEEGLSIFETSHDLPGIGVPGNDYKLQEAFSTRNQFGGGQIGFEYLWRYGPFTATTIGKVAGGSVDQSILNTAFISIKEPTGAVHTSTDRALYVSPSNAGRFTRNRFAVVPEADFHLGIDFNEYVRLSFGYTFIYLDEAARPGNQINTHVNIQPVGTTAAFQPLPGPPSIQSTGFWAQGLDVALRFSF